MHSLLDRSNSATRIAAILLAGLTLALLTPAAHGTTRPIVASKVTAKSCLEQVYGLDLGTAKAIAGSTSPTVVSEFPSTLGRPAASTDAFISSPGLAESLSLKFVRSYDPDGVRLLTTVNGASVYLVPVTLAEPSISAACFHIKALAGIGGLLREERAAQGSGPGVCLASTAPDGGTVAETEDVECGSAATLDGYDGAIDAYLGNSTYELVPDGVSTLEISYEGGVHKSVAVSANLAPLPTTMDGLEFSGTTKQMRGLLQRALPTVIAELNSSGAVVKTLDRPAQAVGLYLGALTYEQSLLSNAESTNTVSSATGGSTPSIYATCTSKGACRSVFTSRRCDDKAKTCTVVTETTTCSAEHVCHSTVKTKTTRDATLSMSGPSGSTSSSGFSSSSSSGVGVLERRGLRSGQMAAQPFHRG